MQRVEGLSSAVGTANIAAVIAIRRNRYAAERIYSSKDETNDICKSIIDNYGIDLVTLNTMETIDGGITNSNENYITIMNNNLDLLNKELYK